MMSAKQEIKSVAVATVAAEARMLRRNILTIEEFYNRSFGTVNMAIAAVRALDGVKDEDLGELENLVKTVYIYWDSETGGNEALTEIERIYDKEFS